MAQSASNRRLTREEGITGSNVKWTKSIGIAQRLFQRQFGGSWRIQGARDSCRGADPRKLTFDIIGAVSSEKRRAAALIRALPSQIIPR